MRAVFRERLAAVGVCLSSEETDLNLLPIEASCRTAKKLKFLAADPAEDVSVPQTKPVEKPVITQEQIMKLIGSFRTCTICA